MTLRDVDNENVECICCDLAKMKRMSYRHTSPSRRLVPLERVEADLAFVSLPTIGNKTNVLHLLDEATRHTWIYLQQTKDDTGWNLSQFQTYAWNTLHRRIGTLHTDQGNEFRQGVMTEVCGYVPTQIFSHPYSPEEVCLVKKANYVLMNKVRSVLVAAGQPDRLWGEAAYYVTYTTNLTGTKALPDNISPHERLLGKTPAVRHLRPWGCVAMMFLDRKYRKGKLSVRAVPTLMMGCASSTKGYRLLNLFTGSVVEARGENVKFYEGHTVSGRYTAALLEEKYDRGRSPEIPDSLPFRP